MNSDTLIGFFIVFCLISLIVIQLNCFLQRRRKTYAKYIEPELARIGLTARSISTASPLNVGPFPKFEIKVRAWHSETLIGSGEFTEYRVVDAVDSEGNSHEIWCKLEFELFQFKSIELRSASQGDRDDFGR